MKDVLGVLWSYVPFMCLRVAEEIGLFQYLSSSKYKTTIEICEQFGLKEKPARAFLGVLGASNILERSPYGWKMTESSSKYLSPDSINDISFLVSRSSDLLSSYNDLKALLREGGPHSRMNWLTEAAFGKQTEYARKFADAMNSMTRVIAHEAVDHLDLSGADSVFDVGCGDGTFSHILYDEWPNIKYFLFDRTEIIKIARENTENEDSFVFVNGDWNEGLPDRKFDVVILSHVLYEDSPSNARRLLRKCSTCVSDGGILVIVSFVPSSHSLDERLSSIFSLNMLFETGGYCFYDEEITDLVSSYGLSVVDTHSLSGGRSLLICRNN